MGVQSPKLFSKNNHSVIFTANPFFLGLCPKIGVAVGGWGSRILNKYMELVLNVRGGWAGSNVWDKVPKKTIFFTPSLSELVGDKGKQ